MIRVLGGSPSESLPACYTCTGTYPWPTCTAPADPYACTGYRLPTEAEWEYAARGGASYPYSGAAAVGDAAWTSSNSSSRTQTTRQKPAGGNGYGLYDMSGNVREWVNDFSNANAYPAYPEGRVTDPLGPATGSGRGLRGGSWALFPLDARVALRTGGGPNSPSRFDGFRLVRTSP